MRGIPERLFTSDIKYFVCSSVLNAPTKFVNFTKRLHKFTTSRMESKIPPGSKVTVLCHKQNRLENKYIPILHIYPSTCSTSTYSMCILVIDSSSYIVHVYPQPMFFIYWLPYMVRVPFMTLMSCRLFIYLFSFYAFVSFLKKSTA